MDMFDKQPDLHDLLARIEALEAKVMDKPVRQSQEVPPEIRQAWSLWTLHMAGQRRWTAAAKKAQIARLWDVSGGNEAKAMRCVETSIERGWTTFYAPKEVASVTPIHKGVKEAMRPTESKLERDVARARQDYHYGVIDAEERDRRIQAATLAHRSA